MSEVNKRSEQNEMLSLYKGIFFFLASQQVICLPK